MRSCSCEFMFVLWDNGLDFVCCILAWSCFVGFGLGVHLLHFGLVFVRGILAWSLFAGCWPGVCLCGFGQEFYLLDFGLELAT